MAKSRPGHCPALSSGLHTPARVIGPFRGDYAFLSNFYHAPVAYEGVWYDTVEHAYQAAKTVDLAQRQMIASCYTPGMAKRVGRTVTMRADWEASKFDVMRALLVHKFSAPGLRTLLVATYPQDLAEINEWGDVFWGVCDGAGANHLGRLLMEVRSLLMH